MASSLEQFQAGIKIIEVDGVEGFWSAVKLIGFSAAYAALIMHLRINLGARETFPLPPEINEKVAEILREKFPYLMEYVEEPHVLFYTSEHYELDNMSAYAIYYCGQLWPTLEHAYQARKFDDPKIIERILKAGSPFEAKDIAHELALRPFVRKNWDEVKEPHMEELMYLKATQHEKVKRKLLATRGSLLVEDSPIDNYYGRGPNFTGKNRCGVLWEKVRDRIEKEENQKRKS